MWESLLFADLEEVYYFKNHMFGTNPDSKHTNETRETYKTSKKNFNLKMHVKEEWNRKSDN